MLFILTGDVQTGKTRWLQSIIEELADKGISCAGVLAPGIWRESEEGFEKLGINNALLPEGTVIEFAKRKDLIDDTQDEAERTQSKKAGLGWAIDDKAINRVNAHLKKLQPGESANSLLIIDELGRLEIQHDGGIAEAIPAVRRWLDKDQDVVVIARAELVDAVQDAFANDTQKIERISPTDEGRHALLKGIGLS